MTTNKKQEPADFQRYDGGGVHIFQPRSQRKTLYNPHCGARAGVVRMQVFWIGPKTTRAASFMQGIEAFLHDDDSENIQTSTAQPSGQ